jgi:hypothetical protein
MVSQMQAQPQVQAIVVIFGDDGFPDFLMSIRPTMGNLGDQGVYQGTTSVLVSDQSV